MNEINNVHDLVDIYINKYIKNGSVAVDGTLGWGKDTLKILELIDTGQVISFDIQEKAINTTKELFKKKFINENKYRLILDNHANIGKYYDGMLDFGILNLGYLPGENKNITTKSNTSLMFIKYVLEKLNRGGALIIVFYPGFNGGKIERDEILRELEKLDQIKYNVLYHKFLNQINTPPELTLIERR